MPHNNSNQLAAPLTLSAFAATPLTHAPPPPPPSLPSPRSQDVARAVSDVDLDSNGTVESLELAHLLRLLQMAAMRAPRRLGGGGGFGVTAAGVGGNRGGRSGGGGSGDGRAGEQASTPAPRPGSRGNGSGSFLDELLADARDGGAQAQLVYGSGLPSLHSLLAESRAPAVRRARFPALERERLIFQMRHVTPKAVRPPAVARPAPETVRHALPPAGPADSDWAVSALGRQFAGAGASGHAAYIATLLLTAFFEPAADPHPQRPGGLAAAAGGGETASDETEAVPCIELRLVEAHYVWAHLLAGANPSPNPNPSPSLGAAHPMLAPAEWHAVLQAWLRAVGRTRLVRSAGRHVLYGVRLAHPSRRTSRPLEPWDTLRLLSFFKVGRSEDVPKARARVLDAIPVGSLWGGGGTPLVVEEEGGGGGGAGRAPDDAAWRLALGLGLDSPPLAVAPV